MVGIRQAPRGVPQIEITFDIDADGVVHVSAKDLDTAQEQAIEVSASGGLSEEEVTQLVSEAESNAAGDHHRRELAELRNKAEGLLYSTQRTLDGCGDEVPDADKQILVEQIALTAGLLKADDLEELKTSVDELSELSYKMTEAMYSGIDEDGADE